VHNDLKEYYTRGAEKHEQKRCVKVVPYLLNGSYLGEEVGRWKGGKYKKSRDLGTVKGGVGGGKCNHKNAEK
jgi:hypothetical protein